MREKNSLENDEPLDDGQPIQWLCDEIQFSWKYSSTWHKLAPKQRRYWFTAEPRVPAPQPAPEANDSPDI